MQNAKLRKPDPEASSGWDGGFDWGLGWIGFVLGLFWVCFFGVGGRLFLRNSFWGKGLGLFVGFGDWVCFA